MDLSTLQRWDRFYDEHPELSEFFRNEAAFFTFLKNYRDALVAQDALVKTKMGLFVDRQRLPDVFLDVVKT